MSTPQPAEPNRLRSPKPWLAGLLSVVVPGLGQVYNGRPRRGAGTWIVFQSIAAFLVYFAVNSSGGVGGILAIVAIALSIIAVVVDSVLTARRSTPHQVTWLSRWYTLAAIVVAAVLIDPPSFYRRYIGEAFRSPSRNMEPSIRAGDLFFATKRVPDRLSRGTIVIFRDENGERFTHRAVAVPGDTVGMRDWTLVVNGQPMTEPYSRIGDSSAIAAPEFSWQERFSLRPTFSSEPTSATWGPLVVPLHHYFVLGDNRANSLDSRYRGLIARDQIAAVPTWIYMSRDPESGSLHWKRIGLGIR